MLPITCDPLKYGQIINIINKILTFKSFYIKPYIQLKKKVILLKKLKIKLLKL